MSDKSVSVSTIDSSESRRPSDSARVPETLEETDSATYDEQWSESRPPWEYHQTRQQWHRDHWLFNELTNKQSTDVKYADADSGTDVNHNSSDSSSDSEDCKLINLDNVKSETPPTEQTKHSKNKRICYPNNQLSQESYDIESDCDYCSSSYDTAAESSTESLGVHSGYHSDGLKTACGDDTSEIHNHAATCSNKPTPSVNRLSKSDYQYEEAYLSEKLTWSLQLLWCLIYFKIWFFIYYVKMNVINMCGYN